MRQRFKVTMRFEHRGWDREVLQEVSPTGELEDKGTACVFQMEAVSFTSVWRHLDATVCEQEIGSPVVVYTVELT